MREDNARSREQSGKRENARSREQDRIRSRKFRGNPDALCMAGAAVMLVLMAALLFPAAFWPAGMPKRVEADCRLKNTTVEDLKLLEEQEKGSMTGLTDLAAWRYGEAGEVIDPSTDRRAAAGVVYAYGTMSLAFPANAVSGSYAQPMGEKDCVLTKELSYALYGAADTCGCLLNFEGKTYRVAAVIDKKEEILMLPLPEGRVEWAAFLFGSGERVKEKMKALGF